MRTTFLISIILESFNAIFAPMIADFYNRKELRKLENLYKIVTKWIFTISFAAFLIIVIFPKEILSLWGKEFAEGTTCLIILCSAQLINCSVGTVTSLIMMTGRTKINLINQLLVFITIITLNLFLIPKYSYLGTAFSLGIALSIINIIGVFEIYLILRIHPYRIDFFKPLIAGVITFTGLLLFRQYLSEIKHPIAFLGSGILIVILVYGLILFILKLSEEDKVILKKIKSKIISKGLIG